LKRLPEGREGAGRCLSSYLLVAVMLTGRPGERDEEVDRAGVQEGCSSPQAFAPTSCGCVVAHLSDVNADLARDFARISDHRYRYDGTKHHPVGATFDPFRPHLSRPSLITRFTAESD